MRRIILITGGQSSGKSFHAEQRALELSPEPVYIATARAEGMEDRIDRHRARRGPEWTTIEEPLRLGRLNLTERVAVIDCVTLWLTNLLFEAEPAREVDVVVTTAERELKEFTAPQTTYIFVTNEVGLGGVAPNAIARDFADIQGRVNRFLAAIADEVTLVAAGIPVKIK
ncbi:MAG: bifunctional adenosylcobinamide kinase/adenosylcobinamide-phosphate guanylyltransferase [Alistipes sp.]|nr:bifunctional adenosylcobinamide kinase/adenosylcobinamide-phosphate guanylyltransferase [Alistipes sp.]